MRLFRKQPHPIWIVVGLGNPGPRYEATRHNVGYMVIDMLVGDAAWTPFRGIPARYILSGDVAYVRSNTYMNESGDAVGPVAKKWGVDPGHVVVVHDELDLPVGKLKLKVGGNENGHNGLKSVSEWLGREYVRVKVGVGRPQGVSVVEHVLGPVDEGTDIAGAAEAVREICAEGMVKAQNSVNARK